MHARPGPLCFLTLVLAAGCGDDETSSPPSGGKTDASELALPRIQFTLDPTFPCRVSKSDPRIVIYLRDHYGVEVVSSADDLTTPGPKVKYLPDAADANDGLMQLPQAVWEEAAALLPTYAADWDTANPDARGTVLLRRFLDATATPFPFEEKTLPLYLCPDIGAAYFMTHWPFYPYLSSVYAPEDQALRWSERDWTDWYMLHELGHWYTFDQPYLRKWTPLLARVYDQFVAADPEFLAGDVWVPATTATSCRDAYPAIYLNMNNLLSHLHINALRRTVLEPDAWEYVKAREKMITGDPYYGGSIDLIEAMSPAEVEDVLAEIADTRVPTDCSVLGL